MTIAIVSQVTTEVLRKNTAVVARVSQVTVEVLRYRPVVVLVGQVVAEVLRPNADIYIPPPPSGFFLLF